MSMKNFEKKIWTNFTHRSTPFIAHVIVTLYIYTSLMLVPLSSLFL